MAKQSAITNINASTTIGLKNHTSVPAYRFYVPQDKAKRKSRAAFHQLEFLSDVFANEGASRFFKIFLLRFLFDSGKTSADESATGMLMAA